MHIIKISLLLILRYKFGIFLIYKKHYRFCEQKVLIAIMNKERNHVVVHITSSTLTEHYVLPQQL